MASARATHTLSVEATPALGAGHVSSSDMAAPRIPTEHLQGQGCPLRNSRMWFKYGQKNILKGTVSRCYYKCRQNGCTARKIVDKSRDGSRRTLVHFTGEHSHPDPMAGAGAELGGEATGCGGEEPTRWGVEGGQGAAGSFRRSPSDADTRTDECVTEEPALEDKAGLVPWPHQQWPQQEHLNSPQGEGQLNLNAPLHHQSGSDVLYQDQYCISSEAPEGVPETAHGMRGLEGHSWEQVRDAGAGRRPSKRGEGQALELSLPFPPLKRLRIPPRGVHSASKQAKPNTLLRCPTEYNEQQRGLVQHANHRPAPCTGEGQREMLEYRTDVHCSFSPPRPTQFQGHLDALPADASSAALEPQYQYMEGQQSGICLPPGQSYQGSDFQQLPRPWDHSSPPDLQPSSLTSCQVTEPREQATCQGWGCSAHHVQGCNTSDRVEVPRPRCNTVYMDHGHPHGCQQEKQQELLIMPGPVLPMAHQQPDTSYAPGPWVPAGTMPMGAMQVQPPATVTPSLHLPAQHPQGCSCQHVGAEAQCGASRPGYPRPQPLSLFGPDSGRHHAAAAHTAPRTMHAQTMAAGAMYEVTGQRTLPLLKAHSPRYRSSSTHLCPKISDAHSSSEEPASPAKPWLELAKASPGETTATVGSSKSRGGSPPSASASTWKFSAEGAIVCPSQESFQAACVDMNVKPCEEATAIDLALRL